MDSLLQQLLPALIGLAIAIIGMFALIAGAIGLYVRSSLNTSAQAYKYVLEDAKSTRELVSKQAEDITKLREAKASDSTKIQMLSDQLSESRQHSRERDERLGELKAKYEQAIDDRKALALRVDELETRQKERHEANTQLQIQLSQIEIDKRTVEVERDTARAALKTANEEIAKLEAEIATLKAAQQAEMSPAPVPAADPLSVPSSPSGIALVQTGGAA